MASKIHKNSDNSGCFIFVLLLLPFFVIIKHFVFSFFKQYQYFGFNPILIRYGYPGLNLFLAVIFLGISIIGIISFIKARDRVKKRRKALIEIGIFFCISLFVGSLHSLFYYLNKDAYIIDPKISEIQNKRINAIYENSINLNNLIIKRANNLKNYVVNRELEVVKYTDYNLLKFNKYLKRITINEKNSEYKIELTTFSNIDTLTIFYEGEELRLYVTHYQKSPPEEVKLKKIFKAIIENKNKSDYVDLIDMVLLNHNMIDEKIRKDKQNMLNSGYASIDLFIYDTLLKSIGQDSGDYRPSSTFSRSLTFLHIILAYLFISIYGGEKILDSIYKKRKKNKT